jgi:imidazole glycerol-phosphate synthase subunit HisH
VKIVVIDYGSGNLRSAAKALERVAADVAPGSAVTVSDDPAAIAPADRIVLPGVGAFADCRRGLYAVPGMVDALTRTVREGGRPFLGICVGMQLMATVGREHGDHPGLGWIAGEVLPIPVKPGLKVPHMGWNSLECLRPGHPLFAGVPTGSHAYFVHSYHFRPADAADLIAETDYGGRLAAVVGRDNLIGTQFHPEKSQMAGLRLIANFLRWRP